jgi:hypothetical protein
MPGTSFNRAEKAVLERMARGHPEEGRLLRQLQGATLSSRESNGHGFYAHFTVSEASGNELRTRNPVASAWAHVRGLDDGMTFLLWAENGLLVALEGAGFGEDIDAIDFDEADLEFYDVPEGSFTGFQPPPPSWKA